MLDYLNRQLSKKERRETAKYMAQYNNITAIIDSKRSNLMPSLTSSVKENPVQETNISTNESDKYLKKKLEIDKLVQAKRSMDIAYNRIKPLHKLIWDEHFINGRADYEIYYDPENGISKRNYYREKDELMVIVAECLEVGTK